MEYNLADVRQQVDTAQRRIAALQEMLGIHTVCVHCEDTVDEVKIELDAAFTNLSAIMGLPKEGY